MSYQKDLIGLKYVIPKDLIGLWFSCNTRQVGVLSNDCLSCHAPIKRVDCINNIVRMI